MTTIPPRRIEPTFFNVGDILNVEFDGRSNKTVINGGTENVFGESNGTRINYGTQNVEQGGIANHSQLGDFFGCGDRPVLNVLNGGTALNTEVDTGGTVNVEKGGIATKTLAAPKMSTAQPPARISITAAKMSTARPPV